MSSATSKGFAAFGPNQDLREWTFELHQMGDDDIEMEVAYCGICHSDLHTLSGEWGDQSWPIIPGHEIIGFVTKLGRNVTKFKEGDRVGVGAQGYSCLHCERCSSHDEPYCTNTHGFAGTYGYRLPDGYVTQGGYAHLHRAHSNFVFKIPHSLPSAEAAPLLCAGITTYSALKYAKAGPGMKVGVIGIGGLGHLGLKLASALGADVCALSTTQSKKPEATSYGATDFLNINNKEELQKSENSFDTILNTSAAITDMQTLCNLVKPHGNITVLGLPKEGVHIPSISLFKNIHFTGVSVGPPWQIEEMLQLCAAKNITAEIELSPLSEVNQALKKVAKNQVRYRMVLAVNEELDKRKHLNRVQ